MRRMARDGVQVNCIVTSPPYYNMRDYGIDAQHGLEPTVAAYVNTLNRTFRIARQLLADNGVAWLLLGDSYRSKSLPGRIGDNSTINSHSHQEESRKARRASGASKRDALTSVKPKDLYGAPWRVALRMQNDGWYLRNDIIWAKTNPKPESVLDRPGRAHEYLFMLTRSSRYYYDANSVREPLAESSIKRLNSNIQNQRGSMRGTDSVQRNRQMKAVRSKTAPGRAVRSVWSFPTALFRGDHFAVAPDALIERCILLTTKPGDVVLDPYIGSGTTARVALRLGRQFIGCEINPKYGAIARQLNSTYGLRL